MEPSWESLYYNQISNGNYHKKNQYLLLLKSKLNYKMYTQELEIEFNLEQ